MHGQIGQLQLSTESKTFTMGLFPEDNRLDISHISPLKPHEEGSYLDAKLELEQNDARFVKVLLHALGQVHILHALLFQGSFPMPCPPLRHRHLSLRLSWSCKMHRHCSRNMVHHIYAVN